MLFILNRQEKVVGVLKNSGKNSVPFFNDLLTEDLATGSETFEFTTVSRNGIGQHLVVGNFIAFKKGKSYKLFQIMQTEEDHQDELYITVYAECAGLQLINSVFRGVKIISASFERVMQTLLSDTSWNVGILPYGLATTYDLDIEQASVYSLLQTYAQQYGVELEFRVELNRGKISKKYIDGYYNRGKVTGKRFTYERDIEGIVRKTDATELYTALIGRGNNEISFKDVTVDGIDKPMGQDFVANQSAYEKYNNNGYHIVGIYECDTDDAKDLLRKTHKRLLEVSEPKVEYDISVLLLCELLGEKWNEVAIGDTISVFDNAFYPPIMVSARVSKLQTSMTDKNANKCTLANFIEVKSNITSEMRKIASQLQGYVDNKFPIGSSDIQDGAVGMDKISDIYTQTITTDILKAGKVETEKLIAKEAEITNAKIENLKAGFIEADKIITDTIVANKAEFDKLEAKVGQIDTLVSGNISSENIQTGGITGSNLNMDTIFVKDANILDLSASKLTAGEINTSKVVISSADGGMRLVGSTQQFVDENNRIRIQLGKDAKGDFDFYILAENGDILFNTRGITGNAIENGLIKEDMVSDGAIGGKKINWSSFVTEFNKDSNTHKLNSSKVLLDGTNQTLDIHFNQLKSKVDDNVSQTESNTTQIGINQGKINTLIQDTTITKDGQTLKLKDEYSKLEQTVGGLKSTVGEQQTTINQNTGKITATESKVSTLEQTVNGFNSELSHVKTTIDEQEEAINSVNSALSGKANSNDVYKKSETMTTSAINSAINQSANSIKLGVSETYETKTNVETKVTTTLNSAKSYADTKKQEAISTASTDATSKVNSAKNELNTAIGKKANSVDVYTKTETYTKSETDSKIKVAKDEINLGVSNTYETKANVESKINNIQIGGRNLLKNTALTTNTSSWSMSSGVSRDTSKVLDGRYSFKSTQSGLTSDSWRGASQYYSPAKEGDKFTVSAYTLSDNISGIDVDARMEIRYFNSSGDRITQTGLSVKPSSNNTWTYFELTGVCPANTVKIDVIVFVTRNGTLWFNGVQLEKGTKATSWTPAVEDVNADIDKKANSTDVYKKSETYTKTETDSAINVAKDSINLGVSQTYETKSNVENKISTAKTEAINTSKGYADTKKSEAISTASTDATNKVNSAKNELNTKIDGIQIGGRNLLLNSDNGYLNDLNVYNNTNVTCSNVNGWRKMTFTNQLNNEIVHDKWFTPTQLGNYTFSIMCRTDATSITSNISVFTHEGGHRTVSASVENLGNGLYRIVSSFSISNLNRIRVVDLQNFKTIGATYVEFRYPMLEVGNKVSAWSQAPEDIDSAINKKANSTDVYTKTETYTKAQTDSAIKVAKDEINLGVSNTYETKTNVETKISSANTSTLNSAKSYADTKKNEAINSASTDATNKVNSAKNELNTAINKKANSVDVYKKSETYTKSETDSKINVAKNDITLSVSNTYETKTNVETKVNNAVNNIQIGGRNLFLNSGFTKGLNYWYAYNCSNPQAVADSSALSGYAVKFTSTGGGIYQRKGGASNNPTNYQNGSVMTVSGYVKSSVAGKVLRPNFENAGANTSKNITCTNANTWYYFTHTYTITSHGFSTITFYGDSGADYYLKDVILEYGNKASTWTPAPEDVQGLIDSKANTTDVYKKSETYTKSETDSAIKVAKDNINLNVSNTYETKTNVTTKVNNAKNEAINSANTTTTEKLKSYSTTEQMNSAINLAKGEITSSVSNTYLTKGDANNTYATKSTLTQTENSIVAKFSASGGYNLLKDSGFLTSSLNTWAVHGHNNPTGGAIEFLAYNQDWGFPDRSVHTCQIRLSNQSGIEYGIKQKINTTIGKKYTVSFYTSAHRVTQGRVIVRTASGSWVNNLSFQPHLYNGGNANIDSWQLVTLTFTATDTVHFLNICINTALDNGYMWVAKPQICEGEVPLPYSINPSEIYEGNTQIDATGITVFNGGLRIKNNSNETVFSGDSKGNLKILGQITTQGNDGKLELASNTLKGFIGNSSANPTYASGIWNPNGAGNVGYVSVGETNALIGDNNGCLYMSPIKNDSAKKAVLRYSRNKGDITGTIEFSNIGSVSLVSKGSSGAQYGLWCNPEGYVYPYSSKEWLGSNTKRWEAGYFNKAYGNTWNQSALIADAVSVASIENGLEPCSLTGEETYKVSDFTDFIKGLNFGIYKLGGTSTCSVADRATNETLTCTFAPTSTYDLRSDNKVSKLFIQDNFDREGNLEQNLNLNTYWSALGVVAQELLREYEELKVENSKLKERLRLIEEKIGL